MSRKKYREWPFGQQRRNRRWPPLLLLGGAAAAAVLLIDLGLAMAGPADEAATKVSGASVPAVDRLPR